MGYEDVNKYWTLLGICQAPYDHQCKCKGGRACLGPANNLEKQKENKQCYFFEPLSIYKDKKRKNKNG